ncbi:MAG: hypothetical protein LBT11_06880, partial [Treponema sp.]|nr:hypothetical protein [Treponema sp.]
MMILKHGRVAPGSVRVVLALAALLCSGCNGLSGPAGKEPATLSLAAWNIQALFDGTDDGTEYGEYRHSAGWSAEKYRARLGAIAQALEGAGGKGPDLVAFMELENAGVLKSLAEDVLGDQGYYWTAFGSNSELSLGLGVLSRYPISRTLTHSITINGETAPRPVLEVWISPDGTAAEASSPVAEARPLVLFVCHWKSKLGGEDNTEGLRRAAARVAARRL